MKRMLLTAGLLLVSGVVPAETVLHFLDAQPVWIEGRAREKNVTVGFHGTFVGPSRGRTALKVAASSLYRGFVNGRFVAHGPARAGHGFFRVDEWDLTALLKPGTNVVAIEVVGYNVNSYYLLDGPSFLQAEVVADGRALVATGRAEGGFSARTIPSRVQKVQRYSFQRPFSEVWRLTPDWDAWRTAVSIVPSTERLELRDPVTLHPRHVPYPAFAVRAPAAQLARGTMARGPMPAAPWKDRSLTGIGPQLGGFPESELSTVPSLEFQAWTNVSRAVAVVTFPGPTNVVALGGGEYRIFDFGVNLTGFLGAEIEATRRTRVFLTFDEILRRGDVDWKRLGCVNVVALELEPGRYRFESFEPYTLRYAKIVAIEGEAVLRRLWLHELANPDVYEASFTANDPRLNRLFEAGRETFRQNALDVFMDCPSRERAGWLCDSFFTARVAPRLSGDTAVERSFIENYALASRFEFLPEGMLPMCYPADHNDGVFIPNWALWFLLELEEYVARSGDRALVETLRPRALALLEFFQKLRNSDGLLEKLPSWVFVEWSKANEWVQDVNYPSNMLFARALEAAGRLYGRPELAADAQRVRETIRRQSFDGRFFVDNAIRQDGTLVRTRNRSEVAQYFAFFFDVATPESHPELWRTLRDDFGPQRKETQAHAEVAPANAFIGNVLRLEVLSRHGHCQQTLDESVGYLLHMAEKTGTLWEHDGDQASCNHGFASHIVHVLYRDVLGLHDVDAVAKTVRLRFTDVNLEWCEGAVPGPDGRIALRWWREGSIYRYRLAVPEGYAVSVETPPGALWRAAL